MKRHCYAVVFASVRTDGDNGYSEAAARMVELASRQKGFISMESARGPDGAGVTVSYWESLEDIAAWKAHPEHIEAQRLGRQLWYRDYSIKVCRVERSAFWKR